LLQVFCGHQDLDDSDPHQYGVNLLHDTDSGTPRGPVPYHSLPANALSPPWFLDDHRSVVLQTGFITSSCAE